MAKVKQVRQLANVEPSPVPALRGERGATARRSPSPSPVDAARLVAQPAVARLAASKGGAAVDRETASREASTKRAPARSSSQNTVNAAGARLAVADVSKPPRKVARRPRAGSLEERKEVAKPASRAKPKRAATPKRGAVATRSSVRNAGKASRATTAKPVAKAIGKPVAKPIGTKVRKLSTRGPATKPARVVSRASTPKGAARRKGAVPGKHLEQAAAPRVVKIRALDPFERCGPRTSVVHMYRVDEQHEGKSAVHLVFFDRHGWYCEHGKTCRAVEDVRRRGKQLGLTI